MTPLEIAEHEIAALRSLNATYLAEFNRLNNLFATAELERQRLEVALRDLVLRCAVKEMQR